MQEELESGKCALCGSDVHMNESEDDYTCTDKNCPCYNGRNAYVVKKLRDNLRQYLGVRL